MFRTLASWVLASLMLTGCSKTKIVADDSDGGTTTTTPSALIGHYRLDGSYADATGRGGPGVASGTGVSFVANRSGQANNALGLDGGELRIPATATNGLSEGTIS